MLARWPFLALTLLLSLSSLPARAAWGSSLGLPSPAPVVDEDGLLSADEDAALDRVVRTIKERSGVEITIFIPSSLRGREIEDFSISVVEDWKLGKKKEDKGLLLTIAPKERKMRIEVGYGLEGDLTDVYTHRLLDDVMRPYFKEGRYFDGIMATLYGIQQKVPLGLEANQQPETAQAGSGGGSRFPLVLVLIIFWILFGSFGTLLRLLGFSVLSGGGGSWRGGGGFGGGGFGGGGGGSSWGGGGGGFGGGGSSSGW